MRARQFAAGLVVGLVLGLALPPLVALMAGRDARADGGGAEVLKGLFEKPDASAAAAKAPSKNALDIADEARRELFNFGELKPAEYDTADLLAFYERQGGSFLTSEVFSAIEEELVQRFQRPCVPKEKLVAALQDGIDHVLVDRASARALLARKEADIEELRVVMAKFPDSSEVYQRALEDLKTRLQDVPHTKADLETLLGDSQWWMVRQVLTVKLATHPEVTAEDLLRYMRRYGDSEVFREALRPRIAELKNLAGM